uniref:ABC transporter permease n=1 Tax=Thermosporothrix sp. COM3 TaxID=2490863 RepID=A0A455SW75_9CHLR|nr:ABC transporter permease [Thermosporothrix sp. COM3]
MLQNVFDDLRLYGHFLELQVRSQFQYKLNLLADIGAYLLMTGLEFVALLLYFIPFPSLLDWKVGEVLLLCSLTYTSFGLADVFGEGIDHFSLIIRQGSFDRFLLRPNSVFLQVLGSEFTLRKFGRVTQGILVFCLALVLLPRSLWTLDKVLVLFLGVLSTATIFLALFLIGAVICFWTVETTELINMVTHGGREMMQYPLTIYNDLLQRFFTFIVPIAFGAYFPTCYILGRPLPFGFPAFVAFLSPICAVVFAFLSSLLWRIGIRHYQGTGS